MSNPSQEQKNHKMLVIKSGFVELYLNALVETANNYEIKVDIFSLEELQGNKAVNLSEYDYVYADGYLNSNLVNTVALHKNKILPKFRPVFGGAVKLYNYLKNYQKRNELKRFYNTLDKIIVVDKQIQNELVNDYAVESNKITIANPVFTKYVSAEQEKPDVKKQFIVATSGVGITKKGCLNFVKAIKLLKDEYYPNIPIKANIIYDEYRHQNNLFIKLYIKLLGLSKTISFVDRQGAMNKIWQNTHCWVCPSNLEQYDNSLFDAMYSKVPVIVASNVNGADFIEDDINGFIFNKNSSHSLADKISEVYARYDEIENVTEQAFEVVNDMTWDKFAEKVFFSLYPEFVVDTDENSNKELAGGIA